MSYRHLKYQAGGLKKFARKKHDNHKTLPFAINGSVKKSQESNKLGDTA